MNTKPLFPLLLLIIFASLFLPVPAQRSGADDEVRDAFLVSRQAKNSARANRRPPARRIGVGYTLYQRNANGDPARVPVTKEFREGDAVRLVIESNVDGYLYIFHTENDGPAKMLFPDARLNDGDNRIKAHTPYQAPSSREPDPKFRWFYFYDKAATERLYLFVTRSPLKGVPAGERLLAYCQANSGACPWRPAAPAWNQLAAKADAPARVSQSEEFGQLLASVEREALERDLGLPADAPAPSVVRISKSPQAQSLVTMITLVHK
jgi:hypothetical protein